MDITELHFNKKRDVVDVRMYIQLQVMARIAANIQKTASQLANNGGRDENWSLAKSWGCETNQYHKDFRKLHSTFNINHESCPKTAVSTFYLGRWSSTNP